MWGYVTLFFGAIIFLLDLYLVYISLGFRKTHCKKCKGYLIKTLQHKDVYVGGKSGKFYKRYLEYTYVYQVNEKEYRIFGGVPGIKSNISHVVDIRYQKKNPRFAYIYRLTFPIQPILALLLFPIWIILVVCGFHFHSMGF